LLALRYYSLMKEPSSKTTHIPYLPELVFMEAKSHRYHTLF
jgi:hypothetical protein